MSAHAESRAPARRFPGKVVAIGLMAFIVVVAFVAQTIHVQNLRARHLASQDALAAEAADAAEAAAAAEAAGTAEAAEPAAD